MYLSRLVLDPRSREAGRDLGDVHQMHRTVMSAFPQVKEQGGARADLAVLHRLDIDQRGSNVTLLVQSGEEPDWGCLPEGYLLNLDRDGQNPATKTISNSLEALRKGQVLRFRLRANPTKRIDTKSVSRRTTPQWQACGLALSDAAGRMVVTQGRSGGLPFGSRLSRQ